MLRFVLFVPVLTFVACSDPAPVAPHPAGKANCSLCEFLGDDNYTIAEGQGDHESPDFSPEADADSTQSDPAPEADADSTQLDPAPEADADSTQLDPDCPLCGFLDDDQYTATDAFFADPNLERAVRQALGRPQGRLTPEDFASLTRLNAKGKNIHSLVGLEHFTNLQWLTLSDNQITDLGPLANLTKLKLLWLENNQIVDIGPLANLTNLQALGLVGNQITDWGPLANLWTNLQWLTVSG